VSSRRYYHKTHSNGKQRKAKARIPGATLAGGRTPAGAIVADVRRSYEGAFGAAMRPNVRALFAAAVPAGFPPDRAAIETILLGRLAQLVATPALRRADPFLACVYEWSARDVPGFTEWIAGFPPLAVDGEGCAGGGR
jgi:hypothetical protein